MPLTPEELASARRGCANDLRVAGINWNKPQINAAFSALDNLFETSWRAAGSAAIDTATTPFVFTNPQKRSIFKHWLNTRFGKE